MDDQRMETPMRTKATTMQTKHLSMEMTDTTTVEADTMHRMHRRDTEAETQAETSTEGAEEEAEAATDKAPLQTVITTTDKTNISNPKDSKTNIGDPKDSKTINEKVETE